MSVPKRGGLAKAKLESTKRPNDVLESIVCENRALGNREVKSQNAKDSESWKAVFCAALALHNRLCMVLGAWCLVRG
jgi:hypothetical protein